MSEKEKEDGIERKKKNTLIPKSSYMKILRISTFMLAVSENQFRVVIQEHKSFSFISVFLGTKKFK